MTLRQLRISMALAMIGGWQSGALATQCDTASLKSWPISRVAELVYDTSDVVGYASVRRAATAPNVEQQEVVMLATAKGRKGTYRLVPERVDGVGRVDGYVRWFSLPPGTKRLLALRRTPDGIMSSGCLMATLASRPPAEMFEAIKARARQK